MFWVCFGSGCLHSGLHRRVTQHQPSSVVPCVPLVLKDGRAEFAVNGFSWKIQNHLKCVCSSYGQVLRGGNARSCSETRSSLSPLLSALLGILTLFTSIEQLILKEIHLLDPLCLTYMRVLGFVYRTKGHFSPFLVSLKCNVCLHHFFGMYLHISEIMSLCKSQVSVKHSKSSWQK